MKTIKTHTPPARIEPTHIDPIFMTPEQHDASKDIRDALNNEELIHVAERYLIDPENTDVKRMLLDPDARPRVIQELDKIAEVANWSIAEALLDSSNGEIDGLNLILGTQFEVDRLSDRLRSSGSALFVEEKYPQPTDSEYWQKETEFINRRKSSGDARWLAVDDSRSAEGLRQEALALGDTTRTLLEAAIALAGVSESVIGVSQRIKGQASLLGKIDKFRQTDWGKAATVADAVDLIGGRIVVEDLGSLEKVMIALEGMEESGSITVLRKENKFIGNDGKPDPYRAIHYVIAIPGTLHTAEIQIKTLSSMVASDLYHNAVYKPSILNLAGELRESVAAYNWRSVESEMEEYARIRGVEVGTASSEIADESEVIRLAIENLEYNTFYDLVLSKINPNQSIEDRTKKLIADFHAKETQKLLDLMDIDESFILSLAAAAHNAYFKKAAADMVYDPTKPQVGHELSEEALRLLPEAAQENYLNRFANFNGANNKFSVLDLGLDKMDANVVEDFFIALGKDTTTQEGKVAELLKLLELHRTGQTQTEKLKKITILNMFHASFDELLNSAKDATGNTYASDSQQASAWRNTLVASQLRAIATSSILTEIGEYNSLGEYRDLTAVAIDGSGHSIREMLTFAIFVSADRTDSEFAGSSYEEFITDANSAWARDFDRVIDSSIMEAALLTQMNTINTILQDTSGTVQLARLQKARLELLTKYLRYAGRRTEAEALRPIIKAEVISILEMQDTSLSAREINRRYESIVDSITDN